MTWVAVAIAGATVATGYMGSRASSKASDASSAASEAQIAFEREKYSDWKDTYGGIEDNLSEYYNSLTPDYYEARGLEAFQKEQQLALENVRSTLAQRGIEDSGIAAAAELAFAQEGAVQKANIRATAPSMAAEEQRSFLQIGLGQNPGESFSRTLADRATNKANAANQASQYAGQATGQAITAVGTGLSDYLNTRAAVPPDPTLVGGGSTGLGRYQVP